MLLDPQTSGGLLISLPERNVKEFYQEVKHLLIAECWTGFDKGDKQDNY
ncbi:selenophosphate synthase [Clostridium saccharobutylicum]|nr:selenophosphate synthase [Clostridium saccharobutylicum]